MTGLGSPIAETVDGDAMSAVGARARAKADFLPELRLGFDNLRAHKLRSLLTMGRGARAGVLVRNAEALERLEKIDTLVVDKTGTLTEGRPALAHVHALTPFDEEELLRLAAGLEQEGSRFRAPPASSPCLAKA